MGTVFSSVAAGFLIYVVRRRRIRAWLATNGMPLQVRVEKVYVDHNTSMSGRHPYRISAQWQSPRDQKIYVFCSGPIWFDPTPYMRQYEVNVRVNIDNPRQYDMDLSFLPEAG